MNTSALKTFAPAVRTQLMEAVTRKLDFALTAQTPDYLTTFAPQVAALRKLAHSDRPGLIERVAYTWFNRLAALRFMDARGWHPFRARVLTPASAAETQPELLKLTRTGALPEELKSHTDPTRLNDLLDGRIPSPDAQGEVYRHLVLAACRFYHALLPNLFEKLDDETELLLPDDLLTEHSVVHGFRTEISDDDCGDGQRANVEILGWLYQFYISERKDQVMARKSAVPTEDIPAVTQLFTPHWIVRYLVENSLGRLWLLNRPGSRLREHMPYFVADAPQVSRVQCSVSSNDGPAAENLKLETENSHLTITKPEEIRLCDPAVGSGHMLTYAFDLLTLIYEEEGYAPTEIPALILRHNLHGLEICPRAAQLAELALVFKAREKSRRFFQPEHLVRPRIIELRDVRFAENELRDYIHALGLGDLFNQPMLRQLHQFEEAKNFGSLIQPCLDERAIAFARRAIEAKDLGGQLFLRETHLKVLRVLEQAEALTQRYHVVVANPPYMGSKGMSAPLKDFAERTYHDSRSDMFAMFIERAFTLVMPAGLTALVTMESWMFLPSYEDFRIQLLQHRTILGAVHMPYLGRGGTSMGISFGTVAAIFSTSAAPAFKAQFSCIRYYETDDHGVPKLFPTTNERFTLASSQDFHKIPGSPIAYWVSNPIREAFTRHPALSALGEAKNGMTTGDNDRFLRFWFEVSNERTSFERVPDALPETADRPWVPYSKGGEFRKWFGNTELILNWGRDGETLKNNRPKSILRNPQFYFREALTWSLTSTLGFGARARRAGFAFDVNGMSLFVEGGKSRHQYVLAFLNSRVAREFLGILNPTIAFQAGDIARLPLSDNARGVVVNAEACVTLAETDWDNFETSWDFRDQPLLRPGLKGATLEASWRNWEAQTTAAIRRMQELETENNRLFIAAYGLDGELQPEVPEEQITLARAEARRDMAAFLSYAVGCMMGRYSLDRPGLVLADAGGTVEDYWRIVGNDETRMTNDEDQKGSEDAAPSPHDSSFAIRHSSFHPDTDGIIPVLDGEWFEDDIVARTRDFLRATFGEATLRENLRFLEDSLGKDLRKYFLTDFYKDHLQTYKKRPIYWLVQSPKKGFQCLIYLHRYSKDTMNLVLNRYLRDYQVKLRNRLAHLTQEQATAGTAKAKTDARKEADKLTKILHECEEWERQTMLPLAQARIELDLDDGVKVNYLKLGEALAPIAGLAAKEED